jgi:hypothetical protein
MQHRDVKPLDRNIVVVGFPGMALVGKTVASYIAEKLGAELIATIYGTKFSAHLIVEAEGIGNLYNVSVYYAKVGSLGVFIVTGSSQPMTDSDQHSLGYFIIKKLKKFNIDEIVAAAAYVSEMVIPNRKVYIVGSNADVVRKYASNGAVPLSEGVITGLNGVIVGWAKVLGINGACVLGETWRSIVELNYIDYTAAKLIIDVLNRVWGLGIDTSELEEKGREVERDIELLLRSAEQQKEYKQEKRPYYYIT